MHELSIAQTIIERVKTIRDENEATAIISVKILVGDLSGVDANALEIAFTAAVENTCFAETSWDIQKIPASVLCKDCGKTTIPDGPFHICTSCHSTNIDITAGRDLTIDEVKTG